MRGNVTNINRKAEFGQTRGYDYFPSLPASQETEERDKGKESEDVDVNLKMV